ncbi:hypothetical protein PG985_008669 [Apiospora marii]|uniref:uncharacterized protein n=1 Tax=Apiospora marii TaxID=335849 RepID=UPI003131E6CD
MGASLLPEVIPLAVGVLVYSIVCLLFSLLLIWLVWVHREKSSYVAMLGYFTCLSTLASIIQQIHTIADWRNIKIDQYNTAVAMSNSIVVAVAGPSTGLDLGLFFVPFLKKIGPSTNISAKILAVTLPVVLISLLQLDVIQASAWAFLLVANVNLILSPALGAIALLLIMGKYIHTKRHLLTWNVRYGKSAPSTSLSLSQPTINSAVTEPKSIYDNWLMIRFTVGFFCLSAFEFAQIMFQLSSMSSIRALGDSADLSGERARLDFLLFMPGCAASFVVFVVFGTTKTFCHTIYDTFVPRCLRERRSKRGSVAASPSTSSRTFTPSIGGGRRVGGSGYPKVAPVTKSNYPNLEDSCLSPCTEEDGMTFKLHDFPKPKPAHTRNSSWPDFSTYVVRMSRQSIRRLTKKKTKDGDDEFPILNSPVHASRANDSAV